MTIYYTLELNGSTTPIIIGVDVAGMQANGLTAYLVTAGVLTDINEPYTVVSFSPNPSGGGGGGQGGGGGGQSTFSVDLKSISYFADPKWPATVTVQAPGPIMAIRNAMNQLNVSPLPTDWQKITVTKIS